MMAESTFRSPGFFEQEIELVPGAVQPSGVPGGIVGTAEKGPAFVPVTVANYVDFVARFGDLNPERPASYAAQQFLANRQALTFTRVLGAGANSTLSDINSTVANGTVKNAGFKVTSARSNLPWVQHDGAVQFLAARHFISASTDGPSEMEGFPVFTDNPSFGITGLSSDTVHVVRAVLFAATGSKVGIAPYSTTDFSAQLTDGAFLGPESLTNGMDRKFKVVISSSLGSTFAKDGGYPGLRILTASLDPSDDSYISRIMNTDPDLFYAKQHLLYLEFPVEKEIAPVQTGSATDYTVAILSGNDTWRDTYGRFDTRYTTPRTPAIISQPYGTFEYDLFHFETISDGEYANDKFKVSISNVQASTDPAQPYGTFDVLLRSFNDDDIEPVSLEQYIKVSLDPRSSNYIARMIGDKKVTYNFDADQTSEKRIVVSGKYPNRSINFRVVMNPSVENGSIPKDALPFGFRGIPVLKTNPSLTDGFNGSLTFGGKTFTGSPRLQSNLGSSQATTTITGSIIPPLPFRFKVTRGTMNESFPNIGNPGINERADARFFWGVKFDSVPLTGSVNDAILNSNIGTLSNNTVRNYTKFQGISKLGTLLDSSEADAFNANKFTMARVALSNSSFTEVTGTAAAHMREAAYIRNAAPSPVDYRISVNGINRVSMATLIASSSQVFNRFQNYNKFSTIFYGGFDGLNILDRDNRLMNDRASSTESGYNGVNGKANGIVEQGLKANAAGTGVNNNIVSSYRSAVDIMTDEFTTRINLLAIPGIREPLVTNYAGAGCKNYQLAMSIKDIPSYDDSGFRIFDSSTRKPNIRQTAEALTSTGVDNNYEAAYYPDVYLDDSVNLRRVKVPASVAALAAISYNDRTSFPWFAPAGFNRAALSFVNNVAVRLNQSDRDTLYDNRINPIASFPQGGFVIFGQKTLQLARSALDRVNVRRLLLEVKRIVSDVAKRLLFEQNNSTTRSRFLNTVNPQLALIQAQAGIEQFRVVMDESNNTELDAEQNRLNGKIVIVPTKTIEFIAIDFIITPSGVSFE
jgi:hypothetical protein